MEADHLNVHTSSLSNTKTLQNMFSYTDPETQLLNVKMKDIEDIFLGKHYYNEWYEAQNFIS